MSDPAARPSLSAFSSIRRGMTLPMIRERLGPPEKESSDGTHVLHYRLGDDSAVQVVYATPQIIKIIHFRLNGTKMTWVPA